jgi:MinD-like ATPase involved in chromosome partitioning or flagellar assembly
VIVNNFFASSRTIIVAGKGGVGKSTVSAALALAAAQTGLSSLLIELDGKPSLVSGTSHIDVRHISPAAALTEYFETHGLARLSKRLVSSGIVDVVATAAPGIDDLLVLGKIKALEREKAADIIIVDGPAAGHAVTFLQAARALHDTVGSGPIRQQAEDVLQFLADPSRCQVMLVTLAEATPVNELIDTAFALEDRVGVALAPIVINAIEEQPLLDIPPSLDASSPIATAARFHNSRVAQQTESISNLRTRLPLPTVRLTYSSSTNTMINDLAKQLRSQIDQLS